MLGFCARGQCGCIKAYSAVGPGKEAASSVGLSLPPSVSSHSFLSPSFRVANVKVWTGGVSSNPWSLVEFWAVLEVKAVESSSSDDFLKNIVRFLFVFVLFFTKV